MQRKNGEHKKIVTKDDISPWMLHRKIGEGKKITTHFAGIFNAPVTTKQELRSLKTLKKSCQKQINTGGHEKHKRYKKVTGFSGALSSKIHQNHCTKKTYSITGGH